MLRQKMHLWITEESKKTRICKNGFVYSVKDLECSKSKHRKSSSCDPQECKVNKNIFCQCGHECNLSECYNKEKILADGCECDSKCKNIKNCRNRQLCQNDCKDECKNYEFTTATEQYLKHTFEMFKTTKKPAILVLATSFSEKSKVNELLSKYGLYATLNISADRGKLTDGQVTVLEKVHQDHGQAPKTNSGHAGSGEQEDFLSYT